MSATMRMRSLHKLRVHHFFPRYFLFFRVLTTFFFVVMCLLSLLPRRSLSASAISFFASNQLPNSPMRTVEGACYNRNGEAAQALSCVAGTTLCRLYSLFPL